MNQTKPIKISDLCEVIYLLFDNSEALKQAYEENCRNARTKLASVEESREKIRKLKEKRKKYESFKGKLPTITSKLQEVISQAGTAGTETFLLGGIGSSKSRDNMKRLDTIAANATIAGEVFNATTRCDLKMLEYDGKITLEEGNKKILVAQYNYYANAANSYSWTFSILNE